jgi:hypothetical protein
MEDSIFVCWASNPGSFSLFILGAGGSGVRIFAEAKYFSLFQIIQKGLWGPASILLDRHLNFFRGVKRPERDVGHLSVSRTEVSLNAFMV